MKQPKMKDVSFAVGLTFCWKGDQYNVYPIMILNKWKYNKDMFLKGIQIKAKVV